MIRTYNSLGVPYGLTDYFIFNNFLFVVKKRGTYLRESD